MDERPVVLLSGFGPFDVHVVNASWECVKNIPKSELEEIYNVKIVTEEIPVAYQQVDQIVPNLWKKHKPILVIHVGVSSIANMITIETNASSHKYNRLDCCGNLPSQGMNCRANDCCTINCELNVKDICSEFNSVFNDIEACESTCAGRYLCEYIYFTSLSIDSSRTLFVHVPDINKPYTLDQLVKGLSMIIELCIKQLRCKC